MTSLRYLYFAGVVVMLGVAALAVNDQPARALAKPAISSKSIVVQASSTPALLSSFAGLTGTAYGTCSNTITVRSTTPVCTVLVGDRTTAQIAALTCADSTMTLCADTTACDLKTWVRDIPANQIAILKTGAGTVSVYVEAFGGCQ